MGVASESAANIARKEPTSTSRTVGASPGTPRSGLSVPSVIETTEAPRLAASKATVSGM
jgi:hypothetical protein